MSVYLVFRTYGPEKCIFLAACSTEEIAKKFCQDNKLIKYEKETIYTTRASALLLAGGSNLVIEKVAVIN